MPDITTVWDPVNARGDWSIAQPPTGGAITDLDGLVITDLDGDVITDLSSNAVYTPGLLAGDDLTTAVLISAYTDALAGPDDDLPAGISDRRGWWGDSEIGSKVWLRRFLPCNAQTAALIQDDLQACLQWLIDDGVAARITAAAQVGAPNRIDAWVTIFKTDGTRRSFAFDWAWAI